jgi:acetyltransferase AlgX (SGNH hydrolase-like protein)
LKWKKGDVVDDSLMLRLPRMTLVERYWEVLTGAGASIRQTTRSLLESALPPIGKTETRAAGIHPDLAFLNLGGKYYKILFVDRLSTDPTEQMLATEHWRAFREALRDFKQICQDNNIVPIIIYIPAPVHIYARYSTEASGTNWLRVRDKQVGARENTEMAVRTLTDELKLAFITLSPVFEAAAQKGQLIYMQLDAHWNLEGREIAADHVANVLKSKFIAPGVTLQQAKGVAAPLGN